MPWKTSILKALSEFETDVRFRLSPNQVSDHDRPIFIVGCGHSGTTLMLKILGAHSRLHAIHYESSIGSDAEKARKLTNTFNKMCSNAGKVRWVEKTPRNIHKIATLTEMFPDARILVMLRDGRDVACSIRQRTGSLEAGIERWIADNTAAIPALDQENVKLVRYENLVEDFESCVREVLTFCGETYEEALKDFHLYDLDYQDTGLNSKWVSAVFRGRKRGQNEHRSRRQQQVHQKLFDGRNAWTKVLSDDDKQVIKDRASELLRYFEYADGNEW